MSENRIPPPLTVPEGYELIPANDHITNDTLVHTIEGWKKMFVPTDSRVRTAAEHEYSEGYLPYGYYCRPIKKAEEEAE